MSAIQRNERQESARQESLGWKLAQMTSAKLRMALELGKSFRLLPHIARFGFWEGLLCRAEKVRKFLCGLLTDGTSILLPIDIDFQRTGRN